MVDDILAPGYRLRPETTTTVREAVWGGPRDDAEFVVEELLSKPDEPRDENRSLNEFADGV